jgi:hypothetical protein
VSIIEVRRPFGWRATNSLLRIGLLSCLDGYMNIALEQTEEHVNGVVTNRYGDAFIRGNNGAYRHSVQVVSLIRPSQFFIYRRRSQFDKFLRSLSELQGVESILVPISCIASARE